MLKKLLNFTRGKNKTSPAKAKVQAVNIDALDEHNPKQRLVLLAQLRKSTDADALSEIGSRLQDNQQLIADFIATPHPMLARLAASRLNTADFDREHWQQLVSLPHSLAFQQLLIDDCDDDQLLLLLASGGHSSELRQQACGKIKQPQQLRELLNNIGNRDKKVRQQIKESLSQQRQLELGAQQQQQQIAELSAQAKHAASHAWSPQLSGKLQLLKRQFDSLGDVINSEQSDLVQRHFKQIDEAVNHHQSELDAAHQAEQINRQQQLLKEELASLLQRLQLNYHPEQEQELATILGAMAEDHSQLQSLLTPLTELYQAHQRYLQQLTALQTLQQLPSHDESQRIALDELLDAIAWPPTADAPCILRELKVQFSRAQTKLITIDASALKQQQDKLRQLLIDCELAVDDKDLKTTNQLSGTIRQLIQQENITNGELNAHWQRLSKRVYELRDWHKFASMPKRQQLCDEMTALTDSKLELHHRADKIKQLQNNWKALGNDFSAESKQLWAVFKAAADAAYEPCKAHFSALQAQRKENALSRERLCQQLEQYLNGNDFEQSDFEQIDLILQQGKREWRQYFPVEKARDRELQQRFNHVIKSINNHRQQRVDVIIIQKQQLIDEAQGLLDNDDLQAAIEQAKQLQQRWQQTGKLPHAIDKKLWHVLRSHLDNLFNQRQQQQQHRESAQLVTVDSANQLIEQLNQLTKFDDHALKVSRDDYLSLIEQYHQLGERPNGAYKQQQKLFKQACERYDERYAGLSNRTRDQQWQQFSQFCQLLNQRDLNVDTLIQAESQQLIESTWATLNGLPEAWRQAVAHRIGQQPSSATDEDQYRELCIELELLFGLETPKEDLALRMELQMRKLKQGLGQTTPDREQLLLNWLGLAGCPDNNLQQRFDRLKAS